ncbi:class I SAM-dependent methyltransferase [Rhizobium sp. BK251]|uniref:class I SAM-dependent DNA methyltransferase n=1 Tax=Rhizobium sp. BK251 TaxID=2512125 RepID=UPI00104DF712|nr:class I SAM-dependent methyltransferase [Rhizobium sp. BK251]TCL69822.1 methyltransferase family protein [Rhizobium sp. BK251]
MVSDRGSPADNIPDLYERHARIWDESRGRTLFERAWMDRFMALVPPGGAILDIGCGSGEPLARHLIASGYALIGVDSSPTLIGMCRARFPDHDWLVADMRGLSLGRRFAGLLAWDSFFHLTPEDQRGMFELFANHAAEGAALMFTSGPAHGEAIGTFAGEPLYHGSLAPEEYRRLLGRHGFEIVAHVAEDASCGGHTIWLARHG